MSTNPSAFQTPYVVFRKLNEQFIWCEFRTGDSRVVERPNDQELTIMKLIYDENRSREEAAGILKLKKGTLDNKISDLIQKMGVDDLGKAYRLTLLLRFLQLPSAIEES